MLAWSMPDGAFASNGTKVITCYRPPKCEVLHNLDFLAVNSHHALASAGGWCRFAGGSAVGKEVYSMAAPTRGTPAPSASLPEDYIELIVKRDGNRPISFAGKILAKASKPSGLAGPIITAAMYKTRGGKFVATLSKDNELRAAMDPILEQSMERGQFHKAQVFDTFDEAVAWFRPGRLTDALRKQLGLDEPERIE